MNEVQIPGSNPASTPAAANTPNSEPHFSQPAVPPTHHKKYWWIGLIVLIAIGLAVGAYAYYFASPTPEQVLARSLEKMNQFNSFSFDGDIAMTVSGMNSALPLGSANPTTGQTEVTFYIDLTGQTESIAGQFPTSNMSMRTTGEGIVLAMNILTTPDDYYFQITEMPFLGFFDAGAIKDQWVRVPLTELEARSSANSSTAKKISETEWTQLEQMVVELELFTVTSQLPDEDVNGVLANHYVLAVNRPALAQIADKFSEYAELENRDDLTQALEMFEIGPIEVWIGKRDYLMHRMSTDVAFTPLEVPGSMKMDFDFTLSDFGQPVNVDVPTGAKTFDELFGGIFSQPEQTLPQPIE